MEFDQMTIEQQIAYLDTQIGELRAQQRKLYAIQNAVTDVERTALRDALVDQRTIAAAKLAAATEMEKV